MQHLAALGLWGFVTDVPDVARAAMGPRESRSRRLDRGRTAGDEIAERLARADRIV